VIAEGVMGEIEQLLRRTMGMTAESIGSSTIHRAVRDHMSDSGVQDIDEYWRRLNGSGRELTELIERIVVPETWFFRYPEAFAALKQLVTSAWIPAHPFGTLRVLSAPCSTGEEPYSIAIALQQCGLTPSQFHIDAVDISERVLAFARRALYGANSFRGNDDRMREQYFAPVQRGFQLAESVRELVHFHQRNLVDIAFHAPSPSYDIVFCRNVLIYLDPPTQATVLSTLRKAMTADGYLFVGPAEVHAAVAQGFQPLGFSMAFVHQNRRVNEPRDDTRAETRLPPRSTVAKLAPPLRSRASIVPRSVLERRSAPVRTSVERNTHEADASSHATFEAARTLADAGRLSDAAALCERVLREQQASAEGYCLLGVIYDALRDQRRAEACYRKALFLDPNHEEGALHLATLLRNNGDEVSARRLETRARRQGGTQ
jgi:chemotaxis protein methyltransferase WspC